jgi:hypothetical protein
MERSSFDEAFGLNLSERGRALYVVPDSPAEAAGVLTLDLVLSVDGVSPTAPSSSGQRIRQLVERRLGVQLVVERPAAHSLVSIAEEELADEGVYWLLAVAACALGEAHALRGALDELARVGLYARDVLARRVSEREAVAVGAAYYVDEVWVKLAGRTLDEVAECCCSDSAHEAVLEVLIRACDEEEPRDVDRDDAGEQPRADMEEGTPKAGPKAEETVEVVEGEDVEAGAVSACDGAVAEPPHQHPARTRTGSGRSGASCA